MRICNRLRLQILVVHDTYNSVQASIDTIHTFLQYALEGSDGMAFISTVPEEQASTEVTQMYQENIEELGYIPNYARLFSHRPHVMAVWGNLLSAIQSAMDPRRYELVTLAAARGLNSSYCMLAHGSILLQNYYSSEELARIASNYGRADLTPAEVAMMSFAEQIVRDATRISQTDVDTLQAYGFDDAEIFDISTTAAARCFMSKTVDALGAEPDENYLALDENLRRVLTVGRPISGQTR